MTGYIVLITIFAIILFIFWIQEPVKKTVVWPVDLKTKKLRDPLLSEKPRWKVIKEENGLAIGFWAGVLLVLLCGLLGSISGS